MCPHSTNIVMTLVWLHCANVSYINLAALVSWITWLKQVNQLLTKKDKWTNSTVNESQSYGALTHRNHILMASLWIKRSLCNVMAKYWLLNWDCVYGCDSKSKGLSFQIWASQKSIVQPAEVMPAHKLTEQGSDFEWKRDKLSSSGISRASIH